MTADAVMLSAESASGQYPVEAVSMMSRIIASTEHHPTYRPIITALEPEVDHTPSHALAGVAADLADTIDAAAIFAYTASGNTVARIARKRPDVPVLAATPHEGVARRLALVWGAHAIHSGDVGTYAEMVDRARTLAGKEEFVRPGERIVVVAGIPFGQSGSTNNLRIAKL